MEYTVDATVCKTLMGVLVEQEDPPSSVLTKLYSHSPMLQKLWLYLVIYSSMHDCVCVVNTGQRQPYVSKLTFHCSTDSAGSREI